LVSVGFEEVGGVWGIAWRQSFFGEEESCSEIEFCFSVPPFHGQLWEQTCSVPFIFFFIGSVRVGVARRFSGEARQAFVVYLPFPSRHPRQIFSPLLCVLSPSRIGRRYNDSTTFPLSFSKFSSTLFERLVIDHQVHDPFSLLYFFMFSLFVIGFFLLLSSLSSSLKKQYSSHAAAPHCSFFPWYGSVYPPNLNKSTCPFFRGTLYAYVPQSAFLYTSFVFWSKTRPQERDFPTLMRFLSPPRGHLSLCLLFFSFAAPFAGSLTPILLEVFSLFAKIRTDE